MERSLLASVLAIAESKITYTLRHAGLVHRDAWSRSMDAATSAAWRRGGCLYDFQFSYRSKPLAGFYWSSTPYDDDLVYGQRLSDGAQNYNLSASALSVRCVRG